MARAPVGDARTRRSRRVLTAAVCAVALAWPVAPAVHAAKKATTKKVAAPTVKRFMLNGGGSYSFGENQDEQGTVEVRDVAIEAYVSKTSRGSVVVNLRGTGTVLIAGQLTTDECVARGSAVHKVVATLGFAMPSSSNGSAQLPTIPSSQIPGATSAPGTIGIAVLNSEPPAIVNTTCPGPPPYVLPWTSAIALEALRLAVQGDPLLVFPLTGGTLARPGAGEGFTWDMRFTLRPGTTPTPTPTTARAPVGGGTTTTRP